MRGRAKPRTAVEHAYITYRRLVATPTYLVRVLSQLEMKVGHRQGTSDAHPSVGFINPTLFARYPRAGETCGFAAPENFKRAALLFDRIIVPAGWARRTTVVPDDFIATCDRFEYDALDIAWQVADDEWREMRGYGAAFDNLSDEEADALVERLTEEARNDPAWHDLVYEISRSREYDKWLDMGFAYSGFGVISKMSGYGSSLWW